MDEKLRQTAMELADRDYSVVYSVEQTESGGSLYMAKNPELIGCMAQGETLEEAIEHLRDARIDYIYDSLASGSPVPAPADKQAEALTIQTGGTATATFVAQFRSSLKITKLVPEDMPDQPIVRQLHQQLNHGN
jgi:predicted RNase H-like HicB family nuclease